jgi:phosphatidylglycerol:prolipoprotein diacylglycerol transferase
MYPELFRIPWIDYPISTFGLMMAVGFLAAAWITAWRMEEEGFDPDVTYTIMVYIVLGGIVGSKLYFAVDNWLRGEGGFLGLLLSRGGITWYGGLIGGVAAGALGCRRLGVPVVPFMNCAASATAVGQALGRIGCFLVGDDYGRPTDLPWGVAFPEGAPPTVVPVHPTQLYEVAWLLPVAAFLWWRRRRSPFVFGEYLALNGLGRIAIEHWRINPELALGLTQPQWIGMGLILVGAGGWILERRRAAAGT